MTRIQQLLQAQIVYLGDVLYFTFKKHVFTGKITKGGLIWKCTWQKPGEDPVPVFADASSIENQHFVRTFESLTDWTETCIQECLDEYHTRYSSWKRVRHQRHDKPMEVLFKHFLKKQPPKAGSKNVLVYEQLAAQTHHIETLNAKLKDWTDWFKKNFPSKPLPVDPVEMPAEETTTASSEARAQPFLLTSDTGQYMVLHRMNEVAPPECVSWLKQNGPDNFKSMLQKFPKTIEFEPLQPNIEESRTKQFVHNFFAHNNNNNRL